jgi:hypothetical protein
MRCSAAQRSTALLVSSVPHQAYDMAAIGAALAGATDAWVHVDRNAGRGQRGAGVLTFSAGGSAGQPSEETVVQSGKSRTRARAEVY